MRIKNFLNKAIKWSESEDLIVGLGLVGSYARNQEKINSDIDLILLCQNSDKYLDNLDWSQNFGTVKNLRKEDYGLVTSIRVWYKDSFEVEYGFTKKSWANIPVDQGTKRVVEDGMQILYDPQGFLLTLQQYICNQENK